MYNSFVFNICGDICGVSLNRAVHILYKSDIGQNFPSTISILNLIPDRKLSWIEAVIHLPSVSMNCGKLFFLCVIFLQASTSDGLPTDELCVSNHQIFHLPIQGGARTGPRCQTGCHLAQAQAILHSANISAVTHWVFHNKEFIAESSRSCHIWHIEISVQKSTMIFKKFYLSILNERKKGHIFGVTHVLVSDNWLFKI